MSKVFLILSFYGLTLAISAQSASVERSIFGIETGFLGIWAHNEVRLSNHIALRSELGLNTGIFGGAFYDGTGFIMTPIIALEPRWYYNLNKRVSRSKRIDGNSGDFVSLNINYQPDWFRIGNQDNIRVVDNSVSFVPTVGLRRSIGKHFTYEAGIGVGHRLVLYDSATGTQVEGELTGNVLLRFGYRF